MSKITGTHSEVGAYEFTTLTTVPGNYKIKIKVLCYIKEQKYKYLYNIIKILDLPGIVEGAKDGKGRGKQVIAGLFKIKIISC